MGFNFDKLKPTLNLSTEQETQFDATVAKFQKQRKESFAAAKENGKMDRSAMMKKMGTLIEKQNNEIATILNKKQYQSYLEFVTPMMSRFSPGYSKTILNQIVTELALDATQAKTLTAINNAFEKSYIEAHDYYHGNNEAAKEYWNKYDEQRKKAIQALVHKEQYTKYLAIVSNHNFSGEHGKGDTSKKEHKH